MQKETDCIVLGKYNPAYVIINDAMEILFVRGNTGPYLEPAPGEASLNLMRMAREDLRLGLRTAIHKARKENVPVIEKGLRVKYNGQFRDLNFEVTPLEIPQYKETFFLVLFEDVTPSPMREPKENAPSKAKPGERKKSAKDRQIATLKKELASTKKSLQAIIEEQETTNKELKVSIEEIQSRNEELQSMNEELETAKEELQSTNEKLITVNDELSNRNLELKRSEELAAESRIFAENIVETVREPLVILDADLRVISANQSFYRTFKVTPEETGKRLIYELGNRQWDIPKLRQLLEEVLLKNTFMGDFEVEHNFPTIGHRVMLLNARRVHREANKAQVILLAIEDITERKWAEKELKKTTVALERSNAELEQLAYVASHDLQEPLRMVASYVQLLAQRYKGRLDSDVDEFITFAVDGANRMQRLIQDLLTYSRVGTHAKPFELTNCETVLRQALTNLQVTIKENEALVTHDLMPTVMADESQLVQLLQNLIGNAIKFRGEKPPHVHVSAKRKGNEWVFSVRDNGIGIAPEYFNRIFIVFQRLHRREEYPGTGIGLPLCKKIVERHGGRIWVESQPGKGSTFYFNLRAEEALAGDAGPIEGVYVDTSIPAKRR